MEEREFSMKAEKSEGEKTMYCLLLAAVAKSEKDDARRRKMIATVFDGAKMRGYSNEELEEGTNNIIMDTNMNARKRGEKEIVRYLYLYSTKEEEELLNKLNHLGDSMLPTGEVMLEEDDLEVLRDLQERAEWSDTRLLRHFDY